LPVKIPVMIDEFRSNVEIGWLLIPFTLNIRHSAPATSGRYW
jgi:hypothetical protein